MPLPLSSASNSSAQAAFIVHSLTILSVLNAFHTFWRKKHYRLFESSVDAVPSTPSAHRVRVDSSPVSSSPLRFLSSLLGAGDAQERAHPDPSRDVWEVAIWDPLPVCLRLFCYFSPGHVLIYRLFLPTSPADPRPSTTIVTAIVVALLLSAQLSLLQSQFSQQEKDSALISKEVLHEYDTKYVHPRTQPLYRDVGTQFSYQASHTTSRDESYNTVDTHTPMVVINRGFKPNPNPNYAQHTDPDGVARKQTTARAQISTPAPTPRSHRTPAQMRDGSSPLRPSTAIKQPNFRSNGKVVDGGHFGIYSHAASPLRKSASTNFDARGQYSNDYARERANVSPEKRAQSPDKRISMPASGVNTVGALQRWGHLKPSSGRRESGRF